MKKLIYIGIFFLFFIINNAYAAVINVDAFTSFSTTMITITADAEDAGKQAYISWSEGTYLVDLNLNGDDLTSSASFICRADADDTSYLNSSNSIPEESCVWMDNGDKVFQCGIVGEETEVFTFEYSIPALEVEDIYLEDYSQFEWSTNEMHFLMFANIKGNIDESWMVRVTYVSPSGYMYFIGESEVSYCIEEEMEDGSYYMTVPLWVDKYEFLSEINYDIEGSGYVEVSIYDTANEMIVDYVDWPDLYLNIYPNLSYDVVTSDINENHKYVSAYVDWFGMDGELVYCVTSDAYLNGDETWIPSEQGVAWLDTILLVPPSAGSQYLHLAARNGSTDVYRTVNLTNYKVWTGADNSYSKDETSVSYSGGIITISGTIYSNTPGTYKIEALDNTHTFTLEGETVYISDSYDSDGYCHCHTYIDKYGTGSCYYCGESPEKYLEKELHLYSEPCRHVPRGYIYTFSMQIDAKKSGIAEGDLTSISYKILRRDDLTWEWDVKKEVTRATTLYIDLTPPKINIYKDDGGSGSSRSYVFQISDDVGLQDDLYYDFVSADYKGEFNYKRIWLYKTYSTSSSTGNYSGSTYGSSGDKSGYAVVSVTVPEDEIMRYKVVVKATDNYGNTTQYITKPYDCGDYTVNITYELKGTGEVIKEKVVETNVSEYTLTTPEIIKVDDVNYNKIQSDWVNAIYKTSQTSAIDEISGNTVNCSAFSETDTIIDLTIYLEDIKYKLFEYEEGVDLTAKIAEKLGISLSECTDGATVPWASDGYKGLDGNKIWPAGVYDNKLYFGYEQEKVKRNNKTEVHYRNTYFIRYDLETEEIKYLKVYGESGGTSWTDSYGWMDIKILKKPYEYTKAVDIEGSAILMEDGSVYEMVYWVDDDNDSYNQYTYRINDVVEILPGTITYMGSWDWDASLVKTKDGSIYAVHKNSERQNSTATLLASNAKLVARLDCKDINYTSEKLWGAFVRLYNSGELTATTQWYRYKWGNNRTHVNLESEGVKAFYSKYYLKESNGVYEVYRVDVTEVDVIEKSLIYSSTIPISEENFYGTRIMQNGNLYSISSGSAKLICSDVKEVDDSYALSNSGEVYDTSGTKLSGLSNVVDICDGYARDSSGVIYSLSSKSSLGITVNANIKSTASFSDASFILFENGELYAKGCISDGPVLGGGTSFEKFKTEIKDMSIGDMWGYKSIKILTAEGEVLGVGHRFYGGFTTSYWDLIDSDEMYVTEFRRVANLPYEDTNHYDEQIWMTYYAEAIDGIHFNRGFNVYDFDLVENTNASIVTSKDGEHTKLDYIYTRIHDNIPDEYLIDISNIGGATITPAMLRRADVENKLYNIDEDLDIASDIIFEKGEGQDKKYGVICKKLNTWYMDGSDYSWYTYKIMWFKIEEYGGIDVSFELTENAKTFEQGIVYLDYKISVDEEADIYFNDMVNNLIVTKGGEETSGVEKVLLRLQKSTGEIIPLNLDTVGKMKIDSGTYKLTVIIGGVNCFTKVTTGGDGYLLTLDKLRFDVLRDGEWIHKLATLGLVKPVEVIDLVDVT